MKRFILISVLFAITAMVWAQQPAIGKCESKEGFTFFQVTDPQLGFHSKDKNLQWTIDNLKAMVSIINREHPAFVIITGDMIHRHYKKNQVEAYRSVIATVDKDIPVFHIPGNHDMPKYADAPRKQYLDNFGYERFSFEYGGYGFIGINSNALVCDTLPAYIDAAEQLEWMYGELKKYDHLKGTFVFAHHPPVLAKGSPVKHKSEWNEPYRTQYVRLMKQHGVKGIFDDLPTLQFHQLSSKIRLKFIQFIFVDVVINVVPANHIVVFIPVTIDKRKENHGFVAVDVLNVFVAGT